MQLLVVNVNTTESMTATIAEQARRCAEPGTEIIALTPTFGADSCESNLDSHLAAIAVADRVLAYTGPYDAVVMAGFGEHGREVLQELLDVPVVDITEAAALVAGLLGRRFSIITTLERTVSLIEDRLLLAGLDRRCASVRATGIDVLELEKDWARTVDAITAEALAAIREDRAEVICFGCAGMADLGEKIQASVGVPVVDGVSAAVKLAESLVRLGLTTSKSGTFAPPRSKTYLGWPLHEAVSPVAHNERVTR
jgi:allantoin racemase